MKVTQGAALILSSIWVPAHISAASITNRQLHPTCAFFGYSIKDSFAATTGGTYTECSAACLSHSECKSFAFDTQSHKDCQLYDVYVDDNINLEYGSPYYFYDIGCETRHTCGQLGDDYRWEPFDYSSNKTSQYCIDRCLSFSNCKSYAYGNNECFIYDTIVQGNIKPRYDSPYRFYDRACYTTSSTTMSTTMATTVTSTKSLTTTTRTSTATASTSAGKSSTTSTNVRTSTTTGRASSSSTTSTKPTSTRISSTKVLSTSLTISNQAYFCTAIN